MAFESDRIGHQGMHPIDGDEFLGQAVGGRMVVDSRIGDPPEGFVQAESTEGIEDPIGE